MGMDKRGVCGDFSAAAMVQSPELKMMTNFMKAMDRAGMPSDPAALTERLAEVREMVAEAKKTETLREFHGAINVGKEANSEAELERGIKNLARELKQHEKLRKDLERMEKKLTGYMRQAAPAEPRHMI